MAGAAQQQAVQNEGVRMFRSPAHYFGAQGGAPVANAGAAVTEEPLVPVVMNYSK